MKKVYQVTFRRRCVTHEEADVAVAANNKREAMEIARRMIADPDEFHDWYPQGDLHCERPTARAAYLVPDDTE